MTKEEMTREKACIKAQDIDFHGGFTIALVTEIYDDFERQLSNLKHNYEAQDIMIADYKKRIAELEDAIYAKSKQVDELKAQRMELWMLLDNIDTSEDIAKDSDKLFRNLCRNEYPKRWDIYEPNDIEG